MKFYDQGSSMPHRSRRCHGSRSRRSSRNRQSGGGWAYGGQTFMSAAGTPVDIRAVTDDCATTQRGGSGEACSGYSGNSRTVRTRRSKRCRRQRGGGCGCMIQAPQIGGGCSVPLMQAGGGCSVPLMQAGGGCSVPLMQAGGGCSVPLMQAGGAYSVDVATNELGKAPIYSSIPCSAQKGGMSPIDAPPLAASSCTAPSALDMPSNTASYSFIKPVGLPTGARYFDVSAMGGSRTRRRRNRSRRSRS